MYPETVGVATLVVLFSHQVLLITFFINKINRGILLAI